jgi:hypothetical protein
LARYWTREYGLDPDEPAHIDFALWEIGSVGRPSARARLAALDPSRAKSSLPVEVRLLSVACRLSLDPDSPPDELGKALAEYEASRELELEPLWPALARHLARRATPEDKALLEDLAQHPEKRDPPLSWGLRYIVRGDILMEDGTVVTIDELCDQLNLPRLPYIEDLLPELEIDWDDEKPPQKQKPKKQTTPRRPPQEKTAKNKKAAKQKKG